MWAHWVPTAKVVPTAAQPEREASGRAADCGASADRLHVTGQAALAGGVDGVWNGTVSSAGIRIHRIG